MTNIAEDKLAVPPLTEAEQTIASLLLSGLGLLAFDAGVVRTQIDGHNVAVLTIDRPVDNTDPDAEVGTAPAAVLLLGEWGEDIARRLADPNTLYVEDAGSTDEGPDLSNDDEV